MERHALWVPFFTFQIIICSSDIYWNYEAYLQGRAIRLVIFLDDIAVFW